MAEGLARKHLGDKFNVFSAGISASQVNPNAAKVMLETGIDTSEQYSKTVTEFLSTPFEYVITVCDGAKETCPVFPNGKEFLHKRFEDPTQGTGNEEEKRALFRRVRNEINNWKGHEETDRNDPDNPGVRFTYSDGPCR